jgi:hypothetical protein
MIEFLMFYNLYMGKPYLFYKVSIYVTILLQCFFTYRDNDERSSDIRDLVTSFSALEEKVLELYTFAKVLC